ncbi:hypothetical protein L226DRAFT_563304 [Lentinus tigrinus ALCF2SS1-7]|uniref:Uncharacterized protein n=1 Tax=Lentinus tigrinus ALCF2SS1-6 TaxID=1328759 RepID=A0A5C2S918_9APHY|nr:hypothetical protein L227DRAFT_600867 [Lentinus tigrinus ALCF2SS1-6]RPD69511.1 hypothetical protein L226DRAFT_563304 [Lentinus tigrinus ALCF2SS1-7]
MYIRLRNAHKAKLEPGVLPTIRGIVLTGQPGIGNSYFAQYVLIQCLANQQAVVFFTSRGSAFFFDEFGVRICSTAQVNAPRTFSEPHFGAPETRIWSPIDAAPQENPVPSNIMSHFLFFVLFTPPDDRYLQDGYRVRKWIMSPWTDEELLMLLSTSDMMPTADAAHTLENVQDLRSRVVENTVNAGLDTLPWLLCSTPLSSSDHLVLLRRASEINPTVMRDDSIEQVYTLKPASVIEKLRTRLKTRNASSQPVQVPMLDSIIFEGLAIKLLSSKPPNGVCRFAWHAQMLPRANRPHCFEYRNASSDNTLVVTEDGAAQLVDDEVLSQCEPSSLRDGQVPGVPTPTNFHAYSDATELDLALGKYFVPLALNAPFDAFFVAGANPRSQMTALWIVQVAVSRTRTGVSRECPTVKELVGTAKGKFRQVDVKYMLMMPHRGYSSIQWNMGEELGEVEGEAFV